MELISYKHDNISPKTQNCLCTQSTLSPPHHFIQCHIGLYGKKKYTFTEIFGTKVVQV